MRRGIDFVQVPTTLLAQVDSSVGGKTGINSRHGKNLVGAFHQPILVLADTALLDTLPPREFRAGYAEVAKYGLLGDADFFAWLEANWQRRVRRRARAREHAIAVSCRAKAAIVARDERETGDRALLNLGHTFGHALRSRLPASRDRLLHGEAVALGMALAFEFSARHGLCRSADADARHARILRRSACRPMSGRCPAGVPGVDALMDLIAQDKKVKRGALTFILVRGIGQAFIDARCRSGRSPRLPAEKLSPDAMTALRLALSRCRPDLPSAVGLLRRQRDGADRVVARQHAAAREAGQRARGHRQPPAGKRASG